MEHNIGSTACTKHPKTAIEAQDPIRQITSTGRISGLEASNMTGDHASTDPSVQQACTKGRTRLESKKSRTNKRRVTKGPFSKAGGAVSKDVYARITERILADLAKGVTPWIRPWRTENGDGRIMRPVRHNGERYRGINVLLLWSSALEHGFSNPRWMTFRQALELGGNVRKGERGSPVVYASALTKTEQDEGGQEVEQEIRVLRHYTVFNIEQIDGLPERFYDTPAPTFPNAIERIENAERFFRNTGASIITRGEKAFYAGGSDHIQMPPFESFFDAERYYGTLAHETVHWTKHPSRLERDFGAKRFGDTSYALEEIVAEMGSAFLCADLEISPVIKDDHASYIASWLLALEDDKRAIVRAAAFAQKAVDYLWSLQPEPAPTSHPGAETLPVPDSPSTPAAGPGLIPTPGLDSPD